MSGQTTDSMSTLARVEMLDDKLRQTRRVGIGALVIFAIVIALLIVDLMRGSTGAGQATEYMLRDANGKPRAWLGMAQNTPALEFYDENGKIVAGFKVSKTDTSLMFLNEQQKVRAKLGLADGHPTLVLYNDAGKERVVLAESEDGHGLVLLNDQNKPAVRLEETKQGPILTPAPKKTQANPKPAGGK